MWIRSKGPIILKRIPGQFLYPLIVSRDCNVPFSQRGLTSSVTALDISFENSEKVKKKVHIWKKEDPRLYSLCEQSYSRDQYCQLMDNRIDSGTSLTQIPADRKYKEILVTKEEGLLTIALNRPLEHNAINFQMYSEWQQALTEAGDDSDVVVAMITGAGDYYCSGNDLSNFMDDKQAANITRIQRELVSAFIHFPKPLLAAINGPAIGISVTVLGLCDLVYASDKATFHTPFMSLGQCPEGCSSITFPTIMETAKANEVLLKGRRLTAQEAYKRNLVTDVLPDKNFRERVNEIANSMARLPPESVIKIKMQRQKQGLKYLEKANMSWSVI